MMGKGFKPYYNWNTFNTKKRKSSCSVIFKVLNLIITGIPSIPPNLHYQYFGYYRFKPYYNWNTFNTFIECYKCKKIQCFKPYYNWNTFNTEYLEAQYTRYAKF